MMERDKAIAVLDMTFGEQEKHYQEVSTDSMGTIANIWGKVESIEFKDNLWNCILICIRTCTNMSDCFLHVDKVLAKLADGITCEYEVVEIEKPQQEVKIAVGS